MSLFNTKTLAKHTKNPAIPDNHQSIIKNWVNQIESGTFKNLNEVQVQGAFAQQIMCKLLGYTDVGEADTYTLAAEYPVAKGRVDLALGTFFGEKDASKNNVLAPLELKGAATKNLDAIMPGRHKTPVQQAFEYARDIKGAKWVLLSNYLELRIYAISETSLVYEQFFFKDLLEPSEYAKFYLLLNAENFLSGRTELLLKESNTADKDISDKLYEDYKQLRETMLSHMITDNPTFTPENLIQPAQKLLDRILFISFAEDKGLIPDNSILKAYEHQDPYNPRPIYQNFIGLFNSVDKGNPALDIPAYNGGLFAKDEVLDSLIVSNALCEGFKDLAKYDFDSEVSVTVLGHIFEQSIADLEILTESITAGVLPKAKGKATSVTGRRKKDGVVYTPDNITQFIVNNTLGAYVDEQFALLFAKYGKYKADATIQWKKGTKVEQQFWYEWQEKLKTIKVVDPAVGSGAFMVAAFDYLYAEYEKINEKLSELTGQRSVLDLNKEILNNNLFGVDLNEESIEITKLSLWLKTAERGKPLESLAANFIAGNSLGFNEPVPGNSFTWQTAFPQIFAEGGFDVVLGNPPYVRMELLKDIKPWLESKFVVATDRLDLYGYFFELGVKLLAPNGRISYISNATFFKTGSGLKLRKYLSEKTTVLKVLDFKDLQIFEGVTTYPAILVLKNEKPNKNHKIRTLILNKEMPSNLENFFNEKESFVLQSQLSCNGWIFEKNTINNLRNKISFGKKTLKEVYGQPQAGVKTGYNEAFIISKKVREEIIKEDPLSAELIKPILFGRDIGKWVARKNSKWIIYIPKKIKNIEDYTAIFDHLIKHKDRLEKRAAKQAWFELQQAQERYLINYESDKILYTDISDRAQFSLDTSKSIIDMTCFIIPASDRYLLGLLNSKVFWFFLSGIATFVRGGFYRVKNQFVEIFPIPESTKPQQEKIAKTASLITELEKNKLKIEIVFTRRLEDLVPEGGEFKLNKKLTSWWELDFSELQIEIKKVFKGSIPLAERNDWQDYFEAEQAKRQELQLKVTLLEDQLNQEVYKLFNLTTEEIALIENEVKTSINSK